MTAVLRERPENPQTSVHPLLQGNVAVLEPSYLDMAPWLEPPTVPFNDKSSRVKETTRSDMAVVNTSSRRRYPRKQRVLRGGTEI